MTRTSLAIVGGVVASEDGLYPADIKIQDGRIAAIAMPGSLGSTDEAINAEWTSHSAGNIGYSLALSSTWKS